MLRLCANSSCYVTTFSGVDCEFGSIVQEGFKCNLADFELLIVFRVICLVFRFGLADFELLIIFEASVESSSGKIACRLCAASIFKTCACKVKCIM